MEGESTKVAGTNRQESKENDAPSRQDSHEVDFSQIFSIRALIKDVINGTSVWVSQLLQLRLPAIV